MVDSVMKRLLTLALLCFASIKYAVSSSADCFGDNTPSQSKSRRDNGDNLAAMTEPRCVFRDHGAFPPVLFDFWGSMGCYNYNVPSAFSADVGRYEIRFAKAPPYRYPVFKPANSDQYWPFNHTDPDVQEAIAVSFVNDNFYRKWLECSHDAAECCRNVLYRQNAVQQDGDCPATWDAWSCFEKSKPDMVVQMPCSPHASSYTGPSCIDYSSKRCFANGTWNATTDYSSCSAKPRLVTRTVFHVVTLAVSVAACVPAVVVFLAYRTLRAPRVAQHRNLLVAIVARNVLVIAFKQAVMMDELNSGTVMTLNEWPCRLLSSLEKLSANAVFACMLMDGVFLHRLLAMVTRKTPVMRWFYLAGILLSVVPAVTWSTLMAVRGGKHCWAVDDESGLQWINDAPRLAMLFVNIALMGHIVWVLITKVKSRTDSEKVKRTAKVTLYMMPLFGLPFVLTLVRPDTESCVWEQVYYFAFYALDGLQGLTVALLFCYFNKEVQDLCLKSLRRSGLYKRCFGDGPLEVKRPTMTTNADNNNTATNQRARQSVLACDGDNNPDTSKQDNGHINKSFED